VSNLDSFDYYLPPHLIASEPPTNRGESRLLVYDRSSKTIVDDFFYNIQKYIPKNSAVIFNDSKVLKARLFAKKSTGGKLELLYERGLGESCFLFRIGGRVKVGDKIEFQDGVFGEVVELYEGGFRSLKVWDSEGLFDRATLFSYLQRFGRTPLPPYIKRSDVCEDELRYQSIFAKNDGSIAAPTASLHFSEKIMDSFLREYDCAFVTLHVGSSTFMPLGGSDIYAHAMHGEFYEISSKAKTIIESDKKLLCVGSTALRSVEEYVRSKKESGDTYIYLNPKNPPIRADFLLTNFHLPKTSLLVMVASILGIEELQRVYAKAIESEYRFYSYGDAMLIV